MPFVRSQDLLNGCVICGSDTEPLIPYCRTHQIENSKKFKAFDQLTDEQLLDLAQQKIDKHKAKKLKVHTQHNQKNSGIYKVYLFFKSYGITEGESKVKKSAFNLAFTKFCPDVAERDIKVLEGVIDSYKEYYLANKESLDRLVEDGYLRQLMDGTYDKGRKKRPKAETQG